MSNDLLILILILVVGLILIAWIKHKTKRINVPCVCLVTGAPKTGKTLLTSTLSKKEYRKVHRQWWIAKHIFHKDVEEPLYYTNGKATFGNLKKWKKNKKTGELYHHRLDKNIRAVTLDSLLRLERYNYKSIIFIQEASLMADNMDVKNVERNVDLSLYAKLIGHETRGGKLYMDTQSNMDTHYSFKRVCSSYLFVHKNKNFLLFRVLYLREMINTESGVNDFEHDVEESMKRVFIPFWYLHKYDRYEYSYLTDELDKSDSPFVEEKGVVSFNPLYVERSDRRKEKKL